MRRPDDWHLHLRDDAALRAVLPFSAARFARAIIMPNLAAPVTTAALALAYRSRIRAVLPPGAQFEPLMTLYLTDATAPAEIDRARAAGCVYGCKLYPAGATTHADAGVTDVRRLDAVFERMAHSGMVLQVHGEVTDPAVDVFDREARFIDTVLEPLAAYYFLKARTPKGRLIDSVARFHLGNGARLERLDWLADTSERALKQSYGLMVNYLYDLDYIERNHEAYAQQRTIVAANGVTRLVTTPTREIVPVSG